MTSIEKKIKREKSKRWRENNPGYFARWYVANKAYARKKAKLWREKNKKSISARYKHWYRENIQARREYSRQLMLRHKALVMSKYGSCCIGCGLDELACLTIDHIHGGGQTERSRLELSSDKFYAKLLREPKRSDLQVLCMSCQWRKNAYGSDIGKWPKIGYLTAG